MHPSLSKEFTLGKGRFESFSDGVFAIAITLLILEVRLPQWVSASSPSSHQARALLEIWPQYLVYAASFATIGIMWINHHALVHYARRITHGCLVANLVLLAFVSFLPFTTEVMGRLGLTRATVVYYGLTMIAISAGYSALQRQIFAANLKTRPRFTLWNLMGLGAYPFATVVGYFVPLAGVAIIALLALFYMMPSNIRAAALPPDDREAGGDTLGA